MPTPQEIDAALVEAIDSLATQIKEVREGAVEVIVEAFIDIGAIDVQDVGEYTVCAHYKGLNVAIKVELA
jgi:hypothetical protein